MTAVDVQADTAGVVAARAKILAAAKSCLGIPYLYGGNGPPGGLDCSRLAEWCCSEAGLSIPRGSAAQFLATGPVTRTGGMPGMLAFFYGGEVGGPRPGHVGVVSAPSEMIDAPYSGVNVRYDMFSAGTTIGPLDFWGFTDPAKFLSPPAPLPPPATLVDVQLRVLSEGCKGYDVRAVQVLVNSFHDPQLVVDSIFGPLTKEAVEAYQKLLGYKVDGIVGAQTWRSILGAPNP
jgi:peptidoglycan hydrolase-like protein with peptidoglycan-binding domain